MALNDFLMSFSNSKIKSISVGANKCCYITIDLDDLDDSLIFDCANDIASSIDALLEEYVPKDQTEECLADLRGYDTDSIHF